MKFHSDALSPTRRMVTWQGEDLDTSTHVVRTLPTNQPSLMGQRFCSVNDRRPNPQPATASAPLREAPAHPCKCTNGIAKSHPLLSPRHNPLVCLPNKKNQSLHRGLYTQEDDGNADDATTATTMSTQSGDDAQRPTAVAKVYLEDGTVLIGRSFGAHKSVEGEVRWAWKRRHNCLAHGNFIS
jgi:hypothetical protein